MRNESGYTLVELLVSSLISLLVVSMAVSSFITHKKVFQKDMQRISLRQNLRGALDILGANVRLAGENFPASFPAIELIDGVAGPDTLIIRRNLYPEVLKVCNPIAAGSGVTLDFGIPGTLSGCTYADQLQNFTVWSAYLSEQGGLADAYVFDPATKQGEFFSFREVWDSGSQLYLELEGGESWSHAYSVGLSAAYITEEWKFTLDEDTLSIIVNEDESNPLPVAAEIEDFQVSIELTDGSVVTSFSANDSWTSVVMISIALTGRRTRKSGDIALQQEASFFPRNILSH